MKLMIELRSTVGESLYEFLVGVARIASDRVGLCSAACTWPRDPRDPRVGVEGVYADVIADVRFAGDGAAFIALERVGLCIRGAPMCVETPAPMGRAVGRAGRTGSEKGGGPPLDTPLYTPLSPASTLTYTLNLNG